MAFDAIETGGSRWFGKKLNCRVINKRKNIPWEFEGISCVANVTIIVSLEKAKVNPTYKHAVCQQKKVDISRDMKDGKDKKAEKHGKGDMFCTELSKGKSGKHIIRSQLSSDY